MKSSNLILQPMLILASLKQRLIAWQPLIAAAILTPIALMIHGYAFGVHDQILWIPYIYYAIEPTLYPHDYLFDQVQTNLPFFQYLLIGPIQWVGLEWTMFLSYLITQFALLLSIFYLASRLVSLPAAYLTMILFIAPPVKIGATDITLYHIYLNPRTLTLPLLILTLAFLWDRRLMAVVILNSIHLIFHPISALPVWLVIFVLLGWWAWNNQYSRTVLGGTVLLLMGVMTGMFFLSRTEGNPMWLDDLWRTILEKRVPYLFLSTWSPQAILSLTAYLVLGIVGWSIQPCDKKTTELSLAVLGVVFGLTLITIVGVDYLGLTMITQLQLGRCWSLIVILSLIFAADLLYHYYQQFGWTNSFLTSQIFILLFIDKGDNLAVSLCLIIASFSIVLVHHYKMWDNLSIANLIIFIVIFLTPFIFSFSELGAVLGVIMLLLGWRFIWHPPSRLYGGLNLFFGMILIFMASNSNEGYLYPKTLHLPTTTISITEKAQDWKTLQLWAAENTPPTAVFATNPDYPGFRLYSQRSPIVETKDGAPAIYSRAYALAWQQRMDAVKQATQLVEQGQLIAGFTMLHDQYPFDYIVTVSAFIIPTLPIVYQNEEFIVYQWLP